MIELEPNNVHHYLSIILFLAWSYFTCTYLCASTHVKYPWVPKSFALLYFHSIYSNVSIWYRLKFKDFPFLFPTWLLITLLMFTILLQMVLSFVRLLQWGIHMVALWMVPRSNHGNRCFSASQVRILTAGRNSAVNLVVTTRTLTPCMGKSQDSWSFHSPAGRMFQTS